MYTTNRIDISGPSGNLDGSMCVPAEKELTSCVVICHPHPLMGGNMQNNIVKAINNRLVAFGIGSLTFNFRGVGSSHGSYDEGIGETEDTIAAIDYVISNYNVEPNQVGVAGYSFGAKVALDTTKYSSTIRPICLVGLSDFDKAVCDRIQTDIPLALIVGGRDKPINQQLINILGSKLRIPPQIHTIDEADHFFRKQESIVSKMCGHFFSLYLHN